MEQVWADKEKLKEVQSMGWLDANHHWEVSAVEPRPSVPSGRQGSEAATERGDAPNRGAALCVAQGASGDTIPLHSQTHGNHGISGYLLPRPIQSGLGATGMGSHDEASGQLRLAVDWGCVQELRFDGARWPRRSGNSWGGDEAGHYSCLGERVPTIAA